MERATPDLNLVKGWKLEQFITPTGVDPNGHKLGKQMPWQPIGRMGDEELSAVYAYLTHLLGLKPLRHDRISLPDIDRRCSSWPGSFAQAQVTDLAT